MIGNDKKFSTSKKIIKSISVLSFAYDTNDENNMIYTSLFVAPTFVEYKMKNISSHFSSSDSFVITGNLNLQFSSIDLLSQFPGRNDELTLDNGVRVSGQSNIVFTESSDYVIYTNTKVIPNYIVR
ncbi:hypothetical protein J6Y73_04055 [bacterium]|nr:hypothetical protein [bacterium]